MTIDQLTADDWHRIEHANQALRGRAGFRRYCEGFEEDGDAPLTFTRATVVDFGSARKSWHTACSAT